MRSGRPAAAVLPALLALVVASGCGERREAAPHGLVIGAILPLTGPASGAGERVRAGLELSAAFAEAPFPVEVRAVDGAGDPRASTRRAWDLLADPEVVAVVGGWGPHTARPLAALLEPRGLPFVALSPRAVPPGAGPVGPPTLHRLESLGAAAARWAVEDTGVRSAAVLLDPARPASVALAAAFEDELVVRGGEIVWRIELDEDREPVRPRGPEPALEVLFAATDTGPVRAAASFGRRLAEAPLLLVEGWAIEDADSLAAEGRTVRVVSWWSAADDAPPAVALLEAARAVDETPSPALAFGWDAVRLLVAAAVDGGPTREGIEASLRSGISVLGATGRLAGRGPAGASESPAVSARGEDGGFLRRVEVVTGRRPAEEGPPAP
jgi:branched-chain amino acid transport system substrate-binding protein